MDIAGLVRAVNSGFLDATKLVNRVRDQRKGTENALPDEPARDLLESLALGPVIVRGHYDHDFKRFGEPYACGDIQAREQMKDILIQLQMNLINMLRVVFMDESEVDFDALQEASDDCRVNAGVCLGQLSQRLSDALKAQAMQSKSDLFRGFPTVPPKRASPSLAYSSSRSTNSSRGYPRTPVDNIMEHYASLSVASSTASTMKPDIPSRMRSESAGARSRGSAKAPKTPARQNEANLPVQQEEAMPQTQIPPSHGLAVHNIPNYPEEDVLSMRRPSSHCLAPEDDNIMLNVDTGTPSDGTNTPMSDLQLVDRAPRRPRDSMYVNSSPDMARLPIQQAPPRDRYGPDDFGPPPSLQERYTPSNISSGDYGFATVYLDSPQRVISPPPSLSFSNRVHDTVDPHLLDHVRYLQQNSRPPRRQGAMPQLQHRQDSLPSNGTTHSGQNPAMHQGTLPAQRPPLPMSPPPLPNYAQNRDVRTPTSAMVPAEIPFSNPRRPPPTGPLPQPPPAVPAPRAAPALALDGHNSSQTSLPRSNLNARTLSPGPQALPTNGSTTSLPRSHNSQASEPTAASRKYTTSDTQFSSLAAQPPQQAQFISNLPLQLPTEKSLLGFCKGAHRLFLGIEPRKAFSVARRPLGMNAMASYWACCKCNFEGPVVETTSVSMVASKKHVFGKSKPDTVKVKEKKEEGFDPRVRISPVVGVDGEKGGVRYKWVFLAKCHVTLKATIDWAGGGRVVREGEMGGFGCLFCCAEGAARGWTTNTNLMNGRASIRSGSTGMSTSSDGAGAAGTPIFGNVQSFMEHLEMHRVEEGWPGAEMRGRMKCVVGRVAGEGEEWEVNFVPMRNRS